MKNEIRASVESHGFRSKSNSYNVWSKIMTNTLNTVDNQTLTLVKNQLVAEDYEK
jgi:hypothetical protein